MLLRRNSSSIEPPPRRHKTTFRLPAALLATLAILVAVAEGGTQLWYRSHEAESQRLRAWNIDWPQNAPAWQEVQVAENAQELLRYNQGGGGAWRGGDGHNWTMYFFRWLPGRTAGLFVKTHRPDVCLPASGMTLQSGPRNRIFEVNGVALPIRAYLFVNGTQKLYVYYCYWDGTTPRPGTDEREDWTAAGRLDSVKRGKRDVGTQMLELVGWGYEDEASAESAAREQLSQVVKRG
jgi:hypothetical protein